MIEFRPKIQVRTRDKVQPQECLVDSTFFEFHNKSQRFVIGYFTTTYCTLPAIIIIILNYP